MDNKEYIIINKSQIEKRIEELKKDLITSENLNDAIRAGIESYEIKQLEWVLSQSTPLIPIIEDAFNEGSFYGKDFINDEILEKDKQDYILNLKLDI